MATMFGMLAVKSDNTADIMWGGLNTNGDVGKEVEAAHFPTKTVEVTGLFGTSGEVDIEGSNDEENWYVLKDDYGNDVSFTAAGVKTVRDNPRYIRPKLVAGTGSISLTVHIVAV